jgi:Leucine-rich repeat (LRR) protein
VLVSLLLATPVAIFWSWLLILPKIVCPEGCSCDEAGFKVNCYYSGLNRIPSNFPTHVRTLVLDGNNITFFENDSFVSRGLVELEFLMAGFCNVRTIELGAFNGLTLLITLSLESNDITEIIPGTFGMVSSLEELYLQYNKIEHLESDVFNGLVKLQYIDLEGNKLQYLYPDTFCGLKNLQSLLLSNNFGFQIPIDSHFINSHSLKHLGISGCNISSMTFETFANVSALELLDLSFNHLSSLHINILKVLPKLSVLNLTRNEISEIIPGTFGMITSLEVLYLKYNKIEHLGSDVFRGLVKLQHIDLEGNELQYLYPDTFRGLKNLQSLFLSNNFDLQIPTDRHFINSFFLKHLGISRCNISSVTFETFANVTALEWLDLSYNHLRSIHINILKVLPELSELYLDDNPLQCDCQLQEVWRWCQDHNIQTAYKEAVPICDTPSEVNGIWWGVLEKGQCLQGNIQYYGDYRNTSYSYKITEDLYMDTNKDILTEILPVKNITSVIRQYGISVTALLFIFGTTGNVILIIIITSNKDMRTVPNMYILSLAISDVVYLTVLLLEDLRYIMLVTWLSDEIGCAFFAFFYQMSVGLTAYSVAVLSFQRYRVTVDPLHVHVSSQPTWRGTGAIICGMWIMAAISTLPTVRSQYLCYLSKLLWSTYYYHYFLVFQLSVFCVFPLCVVAFSYIMTARHLVRNCCSVFEVTQNSRLNTRKNTANIILGLTVVFLISYVPFHIVETCVYTINLHIPSAKAIDEIYRAYNFIYIRAILKYFLSLNSCLNPVALFCTSHAFRRHFKRYINCCCKTKSPPSDFELSRRN